MFRAIALKELRETWWIAGISLTLVTFTVIGNLGLQMKAVPPFFERGTWWAFQVPFQSEGWPLPIIKMGGLVAIVIGAWQTFGETLQGTWAIFLHRAAHRGKLVAAKLAIGLSLVMLVVGLPLLLYAFWAATPGTHASPFEWWMAGPTVRAWGFASVVYFTTFLCGLRTARWWGSRFLPVAIPGLLWLPIVVAPWSGWPTWLLILIADAVLATAILHVAETQDWP